MCIKLIITGLVFANFLQGCESADKVEKRFNAINKINYTKKKTI